MQIRPVMLGRGLALRASAALDSHPRLRWLPPALWAAAIFYLSSQSRPLGRRWPSLPSALAHLFEFAVLAALLHRALAADPQRRQRAVAPAFVLAALYAASDEVHQLSVPERTASLSEYRLDLLGTSLGLGLSQSWARLSVRQARRRRGEGA